MTPQLVVLAGPNGAGKSTFYDVFLSESPLPFLNADLFAKETGIDSVEAARILDATRARMIAGHLGFITEPVFSDPYGAKLDMLREAVAAGYEVTLIYIGVAHADLSALRSSSASRSAATTSRATGSPRASSARSRTSSAPSRSSRPSRSTTTALPTSRTATSRRSGPARWPPAARAACRAGRGASFPPRAATLRD